MAPTPRWQSKDFHVTITVATATYSCVKSSVSLMMGRLCSAGAFTPFPRGWMCPMPGEAGGM